jgi:hypothetical protein
MDVFVKNFTRKLKESRDALERKLGTLAFQARVAPLKTIIKKEMNRRQMGCYDVGQWLVAELQVKHRERYKPVMGQAIGAAVYELLDEKADARIITPAGH